MQRKMEEKKTMTLDPTADYNSVRPFNVHYKSNSRCVATLDAPNSEAWYFALEHLLDIAGRRTANDPPATIAVLLEAAAVLAGDVDKNPISRSEMHAALDIALDKHWEK
jgi:hypothetical protein